MMSSYLSESKMYKIWYLCMYLSCGCSKIRIFDQNYDVEGAVTAHRKGQLLNEHYAEPVVKQGEDNTRFSRL